MHSLLCVSRVSSVSIQYKLFACFHHDNLGPVMSQVPQPFLCGKWLVVAVALLLLLIGQVGRNL